MFCTRGTASTKARGQAYARHVYQQRAKKLVWLGGGEVTAGQVMSELVAAVRTWSEPGARVSRSLMADQGGGWLWEK